MLSRRTPMRRTGFARPLAATRREAKQIDYTPRPRATSSPVEALPGHAPVAKFSHVRDERLRDMCRAMRCQGCGLSECAGVTWAHANWSEYGKGLAIKASDIYVAALGCVCHRKLDQGSEWDEQARRSFWIDAHHRTLVVACMTNSWPAGLRMPEIPEQAYSLTPYL